MVVYWISNYKFYNFIKNRKNDPYVTLLGLENVYVKTNNISKIIIRKKLINQKKYNSFLYFFTPISRFVPQIFITLNRYISDPSDYIRFK
ncbi:hypothetical protein BpHYR1_043205 [Brachionus plicatilis]|uniref:Uncharacterized protein n=1 Tax=Brachionus plicatilis TaxID=10195 RepID=A0A3M7R9J6_BRAPC|nr:hypothetical protein BpHYR1_043205 [Brachionus plicatilis]